MRIGEAPFKTDHNRHLFLSLRQLEGPAARHTAAHPPGSYSTHRKIRHFVVWSSSVQKHRLKKTSAIFFFTSGRWRDLRCGLQLRMRLAVTIITGKSAILFSGLQACRSTIWERQPTFFFFFSGRWGDLQRSIQLRLRLAVTILTRKSAIFVFCSSARGTSSHSLWRSTIKKSNRHLFLFLRQAEWPAARHTAAHAPGSYSTHWKIHHFAVLSSGV